MRRLVPIALLAGAIALGAPDVHAFCGFYVSGADAKLFNNATQVVLMRDGTRTVLSMQNNYQGPPQDFAMVVPVPVVLQKENVKTLARGVFDRVDQLTAPRLVEYWEQDPCPKPRPRRETAPGAGAVYYDMLADEDKKAPRKAVKIEAQFSVGEYDVVVLSATDASALDTWLRQNGYKIPPGAEPYLRPYVQMGMKFFVAKVDVSKVKFERVGNGPEQVVLSPLRFHYDSDAFNLPIRLGLINSGGTQDLVVTILARGQRYEVANYDNVAMPTNIDVSDATKAEFGAFYAALFDDTLKRHPRSIVTEYSWAADSCDPCPTPPLEDSDLLTLGGDALPAAQPDAQGGFVLTRLHARYAKDALGDDLFFRAAPPIVGGREFLQNDGKPEQGARPDSQNNFQARYVIRHPWTGPIACKNPQRGMWGGPTKPGLAGGDPSAPGNVKPAAKIAYVPRVDSLKLAAFLQGPAPPESVLSAGGPTPLLSFPQPVGEAGGDLQPAPVPGPPPGVPRMNPTQGGCAGCNAAPGGGDYAAAGMFAFAFWAMTRKRSKR